MDDCLALLLALSVVANLLLLSLRDFSSSHRPLLSPFFACDVRSNEHIGRAFVQHPELRDTSTAGDAAWASLTTANGGGVYRKDDDTGNVVEDGISMFHQLHCLDMIRKKIQRLEPSSTETINGYNDTQFDHDHYLHCFDYIAQGILCCADGTIEPHIPGAENLSRIDAIVGKGVTHECRNAQRLYDLSTQSESILRDG